MGSYRLEMGGAESGRSVGSSAQRSGCVGRSLLKDVSDQETGARRAYLLAHLSGAAPEGEWWILSIRPR